MDIVLPQEKTYFRSKLACIYCGEKVVSQRILTREHIIPNKIEGRLILRHASCSDCARIINSEIETLVLALSLKAPRTHLGMKTSNPVESLPIGRWESGTHWPPNMKAVNFRFEELTLEEHPFTVVLPLFAPPGILWDRVKTDTFSVTGMAFHWKGPQSSPSAAGTRTAECTMFSPDKTLRFIAKIAHSAAIAVLGDDTFTPLLPDIILGTDKYISYLIGSSISKRSLSQNLHEIRFYLRRRYIVAEIRLFSRHIRIPYLAVVGRAPESIAALHTSALIRSAMAQ